MAVYKLFPSKDASIYSGYPAMNAGLDPILDVANLVTNINPVAKVARSLIKFDQSQIEDVIDNIAKVTGSWDNFSGSLKLNVAKATNVILKSKIEVYPISGSWNNGSGQYLDKPVNHTGVSWVYSDFSGSNKWPTAGFNPLLTASFSGSNNAGGGIWYTGSGGYEGIGPLEFTQSFNLRSDKDLDINVTDALRVWYSSSKKLNAGKIEISNEGFIVKWEKDKEFITESAVTPQLSYYSIDTNTIYPPQLEIKWDDSVYNTGSLDVIATPDLFVALDNNQGIFYSESINNFRLSVRPEFPIRSFQTASVYTTNYALPSQSLYAIKDLDTNEYVVDFDKEFTNISCDSTGSFFTVYMNGLEPERYYSILIQTEIAGQTIVMDENYYFKVVNG
jgi:hypothetical protein|tara:strand:+ start:2357 stop:3526 length:1170 start_codon:yes stop_codon:yes gene_type:complete